MRISMYILDYIDSLPPFSIHNIDDRTFIVNNTDIGIGYASGTVLLLVDRNDTDRSGNYINFKFISIPNKVPWFMSRNFLIKYPTILIPSTDIRDLNNIQAWNK